MTTEQAVYYDSSVTKIDILGALGIMKGYPICASCGRKVVLPLTSGKKKTTSCPYCHHPHMAVRLGDDVFYGYPEPYSYEAAVEALRTISQEKAEGTFNREKWTKKGIEGRLFEKRIKAWLEKKEKDKQKHKIAPSTYGNYATYVKVHFTPLFSMDVTKIKAGDLQDFYDNLQGEPKQKKNIMDALRNSFRWMLDREEIKRIPKWPEMEPVIERECWTLTYEEQQGYLAKIAVEDRDIIEFLMESGLRPAEGCALMKVDIKMSERKGLIRHNYSEADLTERPKQKKEYWIVFSDRAWELIVKNIGNPTPFVFYNTRNKRGYKYKVLNKIWAKTEAPVGLYEATRHSLATQLMDAGEPLKRVQGVMRHADARTTLRYQHAGDENTRQALNRRGKNNVTELRKDVGET